jgi:hypothetical protein
VHGTTLHNWESIRVSGLKPAGDGKGDRLHNHFAATLPGDSGSIVSGLRTASEVHIHLDIAKWLIDGHTLYITKNNVICTQEVVSPLYFKLVVNTRLNQCLHRNRPAQLTPARSEAADLPPIKRWTPTDRVSGGGSSSSTAPAFREEDFPPLSAVLIPRIELKKAQEQMQTNLVAAADVQHVTAPATSTKTALAGVSLSSESDGDDFPALVPDHETKARIILTPAQRDAQRANLLGRMQTVLDNRRQGEKVLHTPPEEPDIELEQHPEQDQAAEPPKLRPYAQFLKDSGKQAKHAWTAKSTSAAAAADTEEWEMDVEEGQDWSTQNWSSWQEPRMDPHEQHMLDIALEDSAQFPENPSEKWWIMAPEPAVPHRQLPQKVFTKTDGHNVLNKHSEPFQVRVKQSRIAEGLPVTRASGEDDRQYSLLTEDPISRDLSKWTLDDAAIERRTATLMGGAKKSQANEESKESLQLSIGIFNMGDVLRASKFRDGTIAYRDTAKGPTPQDLKTNMLLNIFVHSYTHIGIHQEAEGMQLPNVQQYLHEHNLTTCFNSSNTLMVSLRGQGTLEKLGEFHSKHLEWIVVKVVFMNRDSGPYLRSGYSFVNVLSFHINHHSARHKINAVAKEFGDMLQVVVNDQVDIIGGDANGSAQIATENQLIPDVTNCLCNRLMRGILAQVCEGIPMECRPGLHCLDVNTHEMMLEMQNLDCMLGYVISWGRAQHSKTFRSALADKESIPPGLFFCTDLMVTISERAKYFDSTDLWLSESDKGWHRPLLMTIRETACKSKRKRTEEAQARRSQKSQDFKNKKGKGKGKNTGSWNTSSWNSGWTAAGTWAYSAWQADAENDIVPYRARGGLDLLPITNQDMIPNWAFLLFFIMIGICIGKAFDQIRIRFSKNKKQMVDKDTQTMNFVPNLAVTPHGDCYHLPTCEIAMRNTKTTIRRPCAYCEEFICLNFTP